MKHREPSARWTSDPVSSGAWIRRDDKPAFRLVQYRSVPDGFYAMTRAEFDLTIDRIVAALNATDTKG